MLGEVEDFCFHLLYKDLSIKIKSQSWIERRVQQSLYSLLNTRSFLFDKILHFRYTMHMGIGGN